MNLRCHLQVISHFAKCDSRSLHTKGSEVLTQRAPVSLPNAPGHCHMLFITSQLYSLLVCVMGTCALHMSSTHSLVKVGHIGFFSATYRLFKLPELERDCEDYGEAVIYKGTVSTSPQSFTLDNHHVMDAGRVFPVCRNTLHMLTGTRFARHFDKVGDGKIHYGIYPDCGKPIPFSSADSNAGAAPSAKPASSSGAKGGCC